MALPKHPSDEIFEHVQSLAKRMLVLESRLESQNDRLLRSTLYFEARLAKRQEQGATPKSAVAKSGAEKRTDSSSMPVEPWEQRASELCESTQCLCNDAQHIKINKEQHSCDQEAVSATDTGIGDNSLMSSFDQQFLRNQSDEKISTLRRELMSECRSIHEQLSKLEFRVNLESQLASQRSCTVAAEEEESETDKASKLQLALEKVLIEMAGSLRQEVSAFRQELNELHQVEPRENLPAAIHEQIDQLRSSDASLSKAQLEMQKQLDNFFPQAKQPTSTSSPRDAQTVTALLDSMEVEELQESIWTSVFFLGTPLLEFGGSALSFVVLFLNLFMQLLFCGIVYERFTQNPYVQENVDAFWLWRQTIAHDYRNMDLLSGSSLASRVCTETLYRNSLEMSTTQARAVELIRDYLPRDGANAMQQVMCGPTMCVIALICWFSSIAKEMLELRGLSMSTYFLPRGDSTRIESMDGSLVLRKLSLPRKIFIFLMVSIRLYILVTLCIAGTQYVVYTLSVQELLLNCVALAFVLDVDNLLMAFAPRQLRAIILATRPIKRERLGRWHGADGTSVVFIVMLLVSVVTVSCTMLWSFYDNLVQAEEHLCHGEKNFVYTEGASGQIFWVSTNDLDSLDLNGDSSFQTQSVQEILGRDVSDATKLARRLSSLGQLRTYSNQLVQDAFTSCNSDRLESFEVNQLVIQQSVRDFLQVEAKSTEFLQAGGLTIRDVLNITRCQPFSWLCTLKGDLGLRMRMFCPITCGCNDARKYVTDRRLSQGCDDSCDEELLLRARMGNATCEDLAKADLSSQNFMKEFDDYRRRSRDLPGHLIEDSRILHFGDLLHEYGCGAIAQHIQEYGDKNMCRHESFFWFLHMYCPVSCGCHDLTTALSPQAACPIECSATFVTAMITQIINGTVSRPNARGEPVLIGRISGNAGDMDSSTSTTPIWVSALSVTSTTYVTTFLSNVKNLEAAESLASAAADVAINTSTPIDASFTSNASSADTMMYFVSVTTTTSTASQRLGLSDRRPHRRRRSA